MNLLVQFVAELGGDETVRRIFEAAEVEAQEYRFEQVYPEEEFGALVAAGLEVLDVDVPTLEREFAEYFMRVSPELFPAIFELSGDARTLLKRIPTLHRSIPSAANRAAYRDKLFVEDCGEGGIRMRYDSPHRLCGFLKHLTRLTLEYYGEAGDVHEVECSRDGKSACVVEVTFDKAA
ncbi:MAG: heme NO-binding domain-containing protein [Planctomycetota bacterium]